MAGSTNDWSYTATDTGGGELAFNNETLEELFIRLNAAANDGHTVTETERKALHKAYTEYLEWHRAQPPTAAPKQPAPKPKPAVVKPPAPESKQVVQDTPQNQAAPDVALPTSPSKTVTLDRRPSDQPVTPKAATDRYLDRSATRKADEVVDSVVPAPLTEAERKRMIRALEHNECMVTGEPHPTHSDPFARAPTGAGDPVDLFTGALTITSVDLVVPTAIVDIHFERRYRSGRPYFGPFGYSWDHCHNVYLRPLNNGAIAMWDGRLREQTFHPKGAGWEPQYGLTARLEHAGAADVFDVIHPGGTTWHFERPASWSNAERIPLAAITDRHGNATRYSYDALDRVISVLDDAGRGLLFEYGQCGLLERVRDHTGTRQVRYDHHNESEHLERVVQPATLAFPSGVETRYVYDLDAEHPAMRHNILRIIDASGKTYLENEYAGTDAGWAFNSVVRQLSGGFEYLFQYESLQAVPYDEIYLDVLATRTTVGHPDGSLHVHTFNYRGDLLDHRFRLNRDGSYRVVAEQFEYDAAGNVTIAVDPDGVRQVMTYDAANLDPCARRNLLRIDLAAPTPTGPSRTLFRAQYDPQFQLPTRVFDEAGEVTRFLYDFDGAAPSPTGRLQRTELPPVTLPDGTAQQSIIGMEHDARGQVTAIVAADGTRTEYEYVAGGVHDGFLRRVTEDSAGLRRTTLHEYDVAGFPRLITLPGGREWTVTHNALGQTETLTTPPVGGVSATTRYWFGDSGALVRIERPRGAYIDTAIGDPFLADEHDHNVLGHVVASRLAANTARPRQRTYRRDYEGRALAATDASGTRTECRYDERGLLLREVAGAGTPEAQTTSYSYDRVGRLIRVTDPMGRVTQIVRDLWGRVKQVVLPSGATRVMRWGARDLLLELRIEGSPGPGLPDRRLRWEEYEHDERGRILAETRLSFVDDFSTAVPIRTTFAHDPCDRMRELTLARGGTVLFEHDALGRPTRITDERGNTREVVYAAAGDLREETYSDSESGTLRQFTLSHSYDARGRLTISEGRGMRTELDYDDRDLVVEQRGPGGVVTRFELGAFGELEARIEDVGGLALRSIWQYDPEGRLARFTDPSGATTSWIRDVLGRPSMMTMPGGAVWRTAVDLASRTVVRTMPSGSRITLSFDAAHDEPKRMTCFAAPGVDPVPVHDFAYDGLGRLVLAATPNGAVQREYDSLGRLVREVASGRTIAFRYDDVAGSSDLIFPDGRVERTIVDAGGRPTNVMLLVPGVLGGAPADPLIDIEYSGPRKPMALAHGNGVDTSIAYDDTGRIVRVEHSRAGLRLDSYRARFDTQGRRTLVQQLGVPLRNTVHEFDGAGRLVVARWGFLLPPLPDVATPAQHAPALLAAAAASLGATSGETFTLDSGDARTKRTRIGVTVQTYVPGADHRVLSVDAQPISYHDDGHRSADGRYRFDVDVLGRTVRIRDAASGAVLAQMSHDALSRVSDGTLDGVAFSRSFAGDRWVHEVRDGGAVRQASPHPLWPQPLRVADGAETLYPHPDGGLSTLCVTDAGGIVRERHRYSPFGEPELLAADGVTPIVPGLAEPMWRGMPLLGTFGLYTTTWRLYDPELGVFLSRDPMLYADSASPYVYCGQDPVNFADPDGLAKSALNWGDRWNPPLLRFGEKSNTSRQELRPGVPDGADNVIRIEVGNSTITMSEDMFDNLRNASHLMSGEVKENTRVLKREDGPDDPDLDPRAQANARYRWAVLRHLEDRLTVQRIFDEVFLPVLKANPSALLMGAAPPPGLSGSPGTEVPEDDAPRGMSNEAMLTMYAFEANAVAEVRLRSTGLPRESFGPLLYADKGRFMYEYINNMLVQNPAASRRITPMSRNFIEEPDWIPTTTAGRRYDFRTRPNYDLFPLNESQRRIHFNRSYGPTMRGIYYFNARPVVIRAGK